LGTGQSDAEFREKTYGISCKILGGYSQKCEVWKSFPLEKDMKEPKKCNGKNGVGSLKEGEEKSFWKLRLGKLTRGGLSEDEASTVNSLEPG